MSIQKKEKMGWAENSDQFKGCAVRPSYECSGNNENDEYSISSIIRFTKKKLEHVYMK